VDRYTIERGLGVGAFGHVFEARDSVSGQLIALKQLSRLSAVALSRFKREFRAVQGLNHPNLVRLDGLLEHESGWLIAMELVEGQDLLGYIHHGLPTESREWRLRSAFTQLAGALGVLHEHGILHRDVKPDNVRVTKEGRVVLLDFGLVQELSGSGMSSDVAGSPAYMAPEQALTGMLSTAADCYALGVCLYEALADCLPFDEDTALATVQAKQNRLPARPSEQLGRPVVADLEALCMRLLSPSPHERPGLDEVRAVLAAPERDGAPSTPPDIGTLATELFVGREEELKIIDSVHDAARSQGLRLLLVEGESGIGKSALVSEWLRRLEKAEPRALVLRSQCYENEYSAFKAFDAGMQALARKLNRMGGPDGLLLPQHAALLPRHFPSLTSVKALALAPLVEVPVEPLSALRAALTALAKLLDSLASAGPVVLVVDDLQWADPESFRLLRTIAEGAHAPHLMVLATIRPESELERETAAELSLVYARMQVERLVLSGLSSAACEELTRKLLAGHLEAGWLERITAESKGHPLFVSVLSRHATRSKLGASEQLSLAAALSERLRGLDGSAAELVDVLALAGLPCSVAVLARALDVPAEQVQKHAADLVDAKLLRRLPHQQLTCFHDRVRGAALSGIDQARRLALHGALARGIASEANHDVGLLATHLEGAGHMDQALIAHHQAADRALEALAFGRAQHHFARALALAELTGLEQGRSTELRIKHGHALARGGHSALAAQQYLDASVHADAKTRIELRVWAAQHMLQSLQVEAGLATARDVLAELDVPLPRSEAAALAHLVWDRLCLGVSGLRLHDGGGPVPADERTRLNAMWSLAFPVSWLEVLAGGAMTTRHLRRSLAARDQEHLARALAQEATFAAMQKPDVIDRPRQLFARARTLYDPEQSPTLEAWLRLMEGSAALFQWDFKAARVKLESTETLLRTRCRDEPWLMTNVRMGLSNCAWSMGQLGAHEEELERWLSEGAERDDRFAVSSLETAGFGVMRFLLRGEPERVRDRLAEVMAPWPREPFALTHLGELGSLTTEALYAGGDAAWRYLTAERARHQRAFLLTVGVGQAHLSWYRGGAALAAHVSSPRGKHAEGHLSAARSALARLRRSKVPFAQLAAAPILDAQLASLDGDLDRALDQVRLAAEYTEQRGAMGVGLPLRYFEGVLEGGQGGQDKRANALEVLSSQGWKEPRRAVAVACPVVDYLEAT